jgi:hypothetical protein
MWSVSSKRKGYGNVGNTEPQGLSAAKTHDQQPVEKPERGGRHHEQVDRRNRVCMIAQECPPSPILPFKWRFDAKSRDLAWSFERLNARFLRTPPQSWTRSM